MVSFSFLFPFQQIFVHSFHFWRVSTVFFNYIHWFSFNEFYSFQSNSFCFPSRIVSVWMNCFLMLLLLKILSSDKEMEISREEIGTSADETMFTWSKAKIGVTGKSSRQAERELLKNFFIFILKPPFLSLYWKL